jgi:hypothetical protein
MSFNNLLARLSFSGITFFTVLWNFGVASSTEMRAGCCTDLFCIHVHLATLHHYIFSIMGGMHCQIRSLVFMIVWMSRLPSLLLGSRGTATSLDLLQMHVSTPNLLAMTGGMENVESSHAYIYMCMHVCKDGVIYFYTHLIFQRKNGFFHYPVKKVYSGTVYHIIIIDGRNWFKDNFAKVVEEVAFVH